MNNKVIIIVISMYDVKRMKHTEFQNDRATSYSRCGLYTVLLAEFKWFLCYGMCVVRIVIDV